MIQIKNHEQIARMREAGALLHEILTALRPMVEPGVTTGELDAAAEQMIRKAGAIPSFLHYNGYPKSLCVSIDSEVVHGIPSDERVIAEGSVVSIDCGLILNGWQADSAFTVGAGAIAPELQTLIDVTEQCFFEGARAAVNGAHISDIGGAVQRLAESHGYGVVRALTGHGIGRAMHEDPSVPNFRDERRGARLRPGMTLAVEPMIALGTWEVSQLDDGWTIVTDDDQPCSHYEHTLVINEHGLPELLTLPGFSWEDV